MKRAQGQTSHMGWLLIARDLVAWLLLLFIYFFLCLLPVLGQQAQAPVIYSQFIQNVVRFDSTDMSLFRAFHTYADGE